MRNCDNCKHCIEVNCFATDCNKVSIEVYQKYIEETVMDDEVVLDCPEWEDIDK